MAADDPEVAQIIELLFAPNEDPFFIDATAPISLIARDSLQFVQKASKCFGLALGPETLDMTIPELADQIRQRRNT